jgi:hypothetical protein
MTIQAIETKYKGYRFRSRLEARWAVFFDALGIEWEYEKEGYQLEPTDDIAGDETVYYLPDFYLPVLDVWVEVKGEQLSYTDEIKIRRLAHYSKKSVLVVGSIPSKSKFFNSVDNVTQYKGFYYCDKGGLDFTYYFCECSYCGEIGIKFDANSDRIVCCDLNKQNDNEAKYFYGKIGKAYDAARSARFEHGE